MFTTANKNVRVDIETIVQRSNGEKQAIGSGQAESRCAKMYAKGVKIILRTT